MVISHMAGGLVSSEIIKIASEVNELKKQGKVISNLTIGDFDPSHYPIPEELRDKITLAYKKGFTNYPPANGVQVLRDALSQFTQLRHKLLYPATDFLIGGGSRPLIFAAYLTLVDKGDKVVYPVPSWNNNHYCHFTGAEQITVQTHAENNFMPSAAELAPHLKGATLLALCSPLNPTGTMFTAASLGKICDLVLEENSTRKPGQKPLYVLYDQIYSLLTFGNHEHVDPVSLRPEMRAYTIFIDGASKGFASTGVRVGWGFGPPEIVSKMRSILSHVGAWAPTPEQNAMASFLNDSDGVDTFLHDFRFKVRRSLDTLYKGIRALKSEGFPVDVIEPMGAIYLTLKIDIQGRKTPEGEGLQNAMDVNTYLIEKAGLALVPFSAFGASDTSAWYRASVGGCSFSDIESLLPRLKAAIQKLI